MWVNVIINYYLSGVKKNKAFKLRGCGSSVGFSGSGDCSGWRFGGLGWGSSLMVLGPTTPQDSLEPSSLQPHTAAAQHPLISLAVRLSPPWHPLPFVLLDSILMECLQDRYLLQHIIVGKRPTDSLISFALFPSPILFSSHSLFLFAALYSSLVLNIV